MDMWVKMQELEADMEQMATSKIGKECDKDVYSHSVYVKYIQSIASKITGGRQAWFQWQAGIRLLWEMSITSCI